ncbi:glycosyl hydrolase 2 galactose-binding domain-containing protein [Nibricoccus sp. IMCC34717]|uniref:beta-mannosidase n=1 Tax=Nibricoccus sp. IMCC34717 TaxID=3034021 RepID=UPI00384EE02E
MPTVFSLTHSDWHFREADTRGSWLEARVPGCVHTDLLHHKLIPNPYHATDELRVQWIEHRDWEYQTTFDAPEHILDEAAIALVSDGLDTIATVTLNGKVIGRTDNMFAGHRWDVKRLLRRKGNRLHIRFDSARRYVETQRPEHKPREINDPVGGCTRIRKQQCQFGWDWGPRLVTAGVWRDIRLEAWSRARLADVHVRQEHSKGAVRLQLTPEFEGTARGLHLHTSLHLDGQVVAESHDPAPTLAVPNPKLWWPAGHGAQPLYDLHVALRDSEGRILSTWQRRLGLRTIQLDRHADKWGESFQFVVNGRAIFAKGANWVPADSFVAGLTRVDYARDLEAAVEANMNMIRLWGGGVYESEDFYDLCDELGLLVWHDFMFACTLYPFDKAFLNSVRQEAEFQVRRLRHRACLALWCGNNELIQINCEALNKSPRLKKGYEALFHTLLPGVVGQFDGTTDYWPTSEWRGEFSTGHALGEKRGDTHYWDVWHMRRPVAEYEKWQLRFCSEFGMQSYASPDTMREICDPEDNNLFGRTSENHQKNAAGNQIILDYVTRRYGFPQSQDALMILSQINQAYCMQVAVEHYRRISPRCMGAIYWQLNDCWPVASWSSIEHNGRWKALHYVARRFFAPALISAHILGEETQGIGNLRKNSIRKINLHTVYDAPESAEGEVRWDLRHVDGRILRSGRKAVALRYGQSVRQAELDFTAEIEKHTTDFLYLHYALWIGGECVSEDTAFFAAPRFFAWPKGKIEAAFEMQSSHDALVTLRSPVFQHRVFLNVTGITHHPNDNFFDLYPGEARTIHIEFNQPVKLAQLRKRFETHSIVDLT